MRSTLNDNEQIALIGLMRYMVRLDGRTTQDEIGKLQSLLREQYVPRLDSAATPYRAPSLSESVEAQIAALEARADRTFFDDESVRRAALLVVRPEARETIFAALADLAEIDTITLEEAWLLDWLAHEWGLTVEASDGEPTE